MKSLSTQEIHAVSGGASNEEIATNVALIGGTAAFGALIGYAISDTTPTISSENCMQILGAVLIAGAVASSGKSPAQIVDTIRPYVKTLPAIAA